ncbi:Bax inhibitor-1/YccA family protein [Catellatospora sp. KI3]|uniref:Bax inhibitor-1/YccA family protein n=1 Tax=Catellatospora sp. KI3 TaxID=3041620 RepID=UPI00248219FC|nr:Bax inhibitor-1/YccA family protein [Catellatospora sp. KI3]MDI1464830.1 Bax inhibitor-1/YccA family protein [Catellatospora sp. KI3]
MMQSSNPVLTRPIDPPVLERREVGRATVDGVAGRTFVLVAVTVIAAALSWNLLRSPAWTGLFVLGSTLATLALVLVITFKQITNPFVIGGYAVLQGVFLGVVSRELEARFPGIVVQAVIGTFGVFLAMALLYRMRILRATKRFTQIIVGSLVGILLLSLVDFALRLFGGGLGIYKPGTAGIVFALICIVVGALTFIVDFDQVERAVNGGLPARYGWYLAFGLLVGLIFLYWQIIRLLSFIRGR